MSPNLQETADLVIFTKEILNGKLHFLCSVELNITVTGVTSGYFVFHAILFKYLKNLQSFNTVSIHHE